MGNSLQWITSFGKTGDDRPGKRHLESNLGTVPDHRKVEYLKCLRRLCLFRGNVAEQLTLSRRVAPFLECVHSGEPVNRREYDLRPGLFDPSSVCGNSPCPLACPADSSLAGLDGNCRSRPTDGVEL